jgi:hypothetical protein
VSCNSSQFPPAAEHKWPTSVAFKQPLQVKATVSSNVKNPQAQLRILLRLRSSTKLLTRRTAEAFHSLRAIVLPGYRNTALSHYPAILLPCYHTTALSYYHAIPLPCYRITILPYYRATVTAFSPTRTSLPKVAMCCHYKSSLESLTSWTWT